MRLFVDTGVIVAAVQPGDAHHAEANMVLAEVLRGRWRSVHTSDYVLTETLNFLRRKVKRRAAEVAAQRLVFGAPDARPVVTDLPRIHSARFAAALDLYRRRFDRGLSFTDCTTLVVMDEMGIRDLATFDGGFAGLANVVP